jgi:hypothetical protein
MTRTTTQLVCFAYGAGAGALATIAVLVIEYLHRHGGLLP